MRRSAGIVLLGLFVASCGDRYAYRPLVIDVQNLSASARVVVLKAFPADDGVACSAIDLESAQGLSSKLVARWSRDDAGREVSLPEIDESELTLVVYTEDESARAIQMACVDVRYPEIESGRITLRLSAVLAGILPPWGTRSAGSSSIDCSGAEAWRRSSSRTDSMIRARSRSS